VFSPERPPVLPMSAQRPAPVGICLVWSYRSSQPMGLWGPGQSCAAQAHPICAQVAQSPGGRRSASATSHQASHKAQHTKCAPSSALSTTGSFASGLVIVE
jgi:hypothetical protein